MKALIIPVTPFQQNCSVIWDERSKRAAVVDPGGDLDRVLAEVDREQLQLEKILLTHGHLDHAGATAELARLRGLPIEGPHRDDQFLLDELPEVTQRYGFPPAATFTPNRWLEHGDRDSPRPRREGTAVGEFVPSLDGGTHDGTTRRWVGSRTEEIMVPAADGSVRVRIAARVLRCSRL